MDANGMKYGGAVGDYREDLQVKLKDSHVGLFRYGIFNTVVSIEK